MPPAASIRVTIRRGVFPYVEVHHVVGVFLDHGESQTEEGSANNGLFLLSNPSPSVGDAHRALSAPGAKPHSGTRPNSLLVRAVGGRDLSEGYVAGTREALR